MSPQPAEALRAQESLVRAEAALQGYEPRWLFPQTGTQQPMRSSWFHRRVWTPLLRRAAIRHRKPHMIRHTVLSLLLQQGAPLPYISDAHALPHANRGVMARLDRNSVSGATGRNLGATEGAQTPVLSGRIA